MELHYIQKLLHSKRNDQQSEETIREWEKILARRTVDKGLISKICKELASIPRKQMAQLKMGEGPEYTFLWTYKQTTGS
jgi:hypothetical protein